MMMFKRLMKTKDAAPFLRTHVSSSSKTKDAAPFLKSTKGLPGNVSKETYNVSKETYNVSKETYNVSKGLPDNGTSFEITQQCPNNGTSLGVDRNTTHELSNLELVAALLQNGY
jgi:hypothetical protein